MRLRKFTSSAAISMLIWGSVASAAAPVAPATGKRLPPGLSVEAPAAGIRNLCSFVAMAVDRDPAGLNVRAGPGVSHRVVGTIPPALEAEGGLSSLAGPLVNVLASQDGWFQIEGAREDPELTGRPARPIYHGRGWVSGRMLAVNLQSTRGFERPDAESREVANLVDLQNAGIDVVGRRLTGCLGEWAYIVHDLREHATPGAPTVSQPAWYRGICDIFETTCDGLTADY
jgi:hypothetical protein